MKTPFDYDSTFDDWQNDSAAREKAADDAALRDMREVETGPRCCDNPANFKCEPSLDRDPDTGYFEGSYYRCAQCRNLICEEDYAAICMWAQRIQEPEAVPAEIDQKTRIHEKRIA
jgi:hypothetical protein